MGLRGLLVATALTFALIIYMLVAVPTITRLAPLVTGGSVAAQGYSGQSSLVIRTALVFVPTMFGIGIIIYAYASIQRTESFFGGGAGPPR